MGQLAASEWVALISGFGGAVLGAVVGGAISWLLARQAAHESRRRDGEQRNAAEKAAAVRTTLKVQQITNGTFTVAQVIRKGVTDAQAQGLELWQVLRPHVGSKADVKINAEDLAPFLDPSGNPFVDSITLAALRYEVLETTLIDYSARRAKLGDLLAPYTVLDMETGAGTTEVPQDQQALVKTRVFELKDLLQQLRDFAEDDLKANLALCDHVTSYGAAKYGFFPKLQLPSAEQ
ncbi:hypothetical protein [Mesorhizobium sp. BR-1-1-10]|uniref:hypothetical protein n=1 Tax=Mesorhizobium sp. BR-1-1-10 TaxID=2876660 RepID=UPI001CD08981|nr:hypothetical protein [Mesorhizobium sp. BR-1-1-10]MBZ9974575.1 hypothetical protein [Mesorhizobium sp. BR-1-1-10]